MSKNRLLVKNLIVSVLWRGGSYLLYALSIPLYLKYFSNDTYVSGFWFVIVSACSWILTFDLGVGNGLRNRLVVLFHRGKKWAAGQAIISAYLINLGLATGLFLIALLILIVLRYVIENRVVVDHFVAIAIVAFAISLQFILRTVSFVLYALQKSSVVGGFNLFTNIIIYIFLIGCGSIDVDLKEKFDILAGVYLFAINFPPLVFGIFRLSLFSRLLGAGKTRVSERLIKMNALRIFGSGAGFFSNQILYLLIVQSTPILIGSIVSPSLVVSYTAYATVFLAALMLVNMVATPLWSLITKSIHEGDYLWIRKWMRIMFILSVGLGVVQLGLYIVFPFIQHAWLGGNSIVPLSGSDRLIFLFYSMALICHAIASTYACAISSLKLQRKFYIIALLAKIIVVFYLTVAHSDFWPMIILSDALILSVYSYFEVRGIKKLVG